MVEGQTARKHRKERTGEVVSDKMDKTIVVRVERRFRHPKFKKVVTQYKKFYAHDEKEEAKIRTDVLALPHSTTPSFLADLVRGGPTELDLLVGAVSRMGAEHGVPTPIHDFAFTAFEAATR